MITVFRKIVNNDAFKEIKDIFKFKLEDRDGTHNPFGWKVKKYRSRTCIMLNPKVNLRQELQKIEMTPEFMAIELLLSHSYGNAPIKLDPP